MEHIRFRKSDPHNLYTIRKALKKLISIVTVADFRGCGKNVKKNKKLNVASWQPFFYDFRFKSG